MADSSNEIGAGRVSFLREEQKQRIYDTALGILADIGMVVLHEEGEQVMLEGGCTKDEEDGLVHVPAALVEQARESVPKSFVVYDRAGEQAMDLGGLRSYFGNGSDVMHLHDLETGERRGQVQPRELRRLVRERRDRRHREGASQGDRAACHAPGRAAARRLAERLDAVVPAG